MIHWHHKVYLGDRILFQGASRKAHERMEAFLSDHPNAELVLVGPEGEASLWVHKLDSGDEPERIECVLDDSTLNKLLIKMAPDLTKEDE